MKTVLFDLDGTLVEPRLGFVRSINYALEKMGQETEQDSQVTPFIGPPLEVAFRGLLRDPSPENIRRAVEFYRERYRDVGWKENTIIPGIYSELQKLLQLGLRMHVVTFKSAEFAQKIIERHDMDVMIEEVRGCFEGQSKADKIGELLQEGLCETDSLMVGDRKGDVEAAAVHGLATIGVLWGWGDRAELEAAGVSKLLEKPQQLSKALGF